MTDKAYIVINDQQEREVLEKLERDGFKWLGGAKPTEFRPSKGTVSLFPYAIFVGYGITWNILTKITSKEIVFDGRKEEQMSGKYVVSQEFMSNLKNWKRDLMTYGKHGYFIGYRDIGGLPACVYDWLGENISNEENNNRLIAIIRWVNGEDVFEVEKPKKWVVRSKKRNEQGNYLYVYLIDSNGVKDVMTGWTKDIANKFNTKEEAQEWANSHQEIIEVDE